MKNLELVSIIIPAFNAQDFIAETLDSVLAQTYPNIEVIVVDDGSTDQTAQIVQSYGTQVQYFYQPNSGGCAVPRNTGIKRSSGEFLCFHDADDIMLQGRISSQVDFMQRNPHLGLVFCDYRNFSLQKGEFPQSHFQTCPRLWHLLRDKTELVIENPCLHLVHENFGCAGSLIVRRFIFEYEAGFNPDLEASEDFYFYFRQARHFRVGVVNKVGMLRRLHTQNMTSNLLKMLSCQIQTRTLLRDSEEDPEVRRCLSRFIINCKSSLARFHADRGFFWEALQCDLQSLSKPFFWPETGLCCRSILRTILMAMGLHQPRSGKVEVDHLKV